VSDRDSGPTEQQVARGWRGVARPIVWLRFLIVPAWIDGVIFAGSRLPSAFETGETDAGSLVPSSSRAVEVEERADKVFGTPLLTRTMVVAGRSTGFGASELSAAGHYIAATDRKEGEAAIRAVPLANARGVLAAKETATTLVVYLYVPTVLSEVEQQDAAERFAAGFGRVSGAEAVKVTGPCPGPGPKPTSRTATSSGSRSPPC
jgi:hypothetical protein